MRNKLNMFYHSGTCWLPVKKKVATASVVFIFFLLVSALEFLGWIDIRPNIPSVLYVLILVILAVL
ncbi:hypothetical protein CFP56_038077 [Quercus suber]|uniref:Uncharacterized protein n=1 Tax=Quercus suber TaxID=58331 RepID=A0AAW0J2V4_QUESU